MVRLSNMPHGQNAVQMHFLRMDGRHRAWHGRRLCRTATSASGQHESGDERNENARTHGRSIAYRIARG